jgi:F0F1-type ATP synthase membrane subunit c/vacuolar-type H+-ATPase subunit K
MRILSAFVVLFALFLFLPFSCRAQQLNFSGNESFQITTVDKVSSGSLISLNEQGYFLSATEYDPQFVGVINFNPDVYFGQDTENQKDTYPLTVSGKVPVLVSNINGALEIGDNITTSKTAGIGQKASEDGFVIGRSLEKQDFADGSPQLVLVQLDPHIHSKVLVFDSKVGSSGLKRIMAVFYNFLKTGGASAQNEPSKAFRYILSVIVVVISLLFGFLLFGRVALRGLEAMGRNPLAAKMITTGILINSVLTIVVALCGLVLAYIIVTY